MNGNNFAPFPHHKLLAYEVALEFVRVIHATHISDAVQRKHARDSAGSCARNLAEGAGRRSRADKRRCYSIAHGECPVEELHNVYRVCSRLNAMLVSLTR